jgi:hypothetical protein
MADFQCNSFQKPHHRDFVMIKKLVSAVGSCETKPSFFTGAQSRNVFTSIVDAQYDYGRLQIKAMPMHSTIMAAC